ncbi:MAG: sulfate adenylyltransferase [Chloroflexota bacterium]
MAKIANVSFSQIRANDPDFNSQKRQYSQRQLILPHGGQLVNRQVPIGQRQAAIKRAKTLFQLPISSFHAADVEMLGIGAYSPLIGFMGRADYLSVIDSMRLDNGIVWPLPITLPVSQDLVNKINLDQEIALVFAKEPIATMRVTEKFTYDKLHEAIQVYGTDERQHPGVERLYQHGEVLLGGSICYLGAAESEQFASIRYTPQQMRCIFASKGWHTVVAFQTRNPVHRVHEFIQKEALKAVDALLIHPLVGAKKEGDFGGQACVASYEAVLPKHYPLNQVWLGVFPSAMRYAGPREAIFHALCRKNYGCSHFIVGRDHAGVKDYYGKFAARDIFKQFSQDEIGVIVPPYTSPSYCPVCDRIVASDECEHSDELKDVRGTRIRELARRSKPAPTRFIRPEAWPILRREYSRERFKHNWLYLGNDADRFEDAYLAFQI